MRKALVLVSLLALALPVAGLGALAAKRIGEGTLSIEDGRGKVIVQARGGAIGRLERGTVRIFDLTPNDANVPVVSGNDRPLKFIGANGIEYAGVGLRFRVIGGGFRIVIEGRGIDLSVVGRGSGLIRGETVEPGLYSLEGSDCRSRPATCEPLPEIATRFQLGGPEHGEQNAVRPTAG
ncbi:MAG TPA: hypothetical protein VM184_11065 [Gaiellaceae bacterium]|nr:hypothetical protein [Gaiellaceae bacterium]